MNNLTNIEGLEIGDRMEIKEDVLAKGKKWIHYIRMETLTKENGETTKNYIFIECNTKASGEKITIEAPLDETEYQNRLK